jgi:SAM-dependent methyltransferase
MKKTAKQLGRDLLGGEDNVAVRRFRDRLMSRLGLEQGRGRRALDLGCGDGLMTEYLLERGWKVQGLDMEPHPAWKRLQARWKRQLTLTCGDALKPPKGAWDLVLEKDMLHHAEDPLAVLKAMRSAAGKGGQVLVVEANRLNPVFYLHLTLMEGHEHFTRSRLLGLCQAAGLQGGVLDRIEARVWPVQNPRLQDLADAAQDLAERVFFLKPFLCYHAYRWNA